MATRATSGSTRTLTKKPRTKRKRQCELGATCPYQDEYQHKLEFAHDGNANSNANSNRNKTNSSGTTGDQKKKTALNGTGALKGTGSRGRKLAVAADRKRAEQTLRNDGEHSLNGSAGDVRDAQRARRVMQMQKQIQEGTQHPRSASTAGSGCGGGGSGGGGGTTAAGARSTSAVPRTAAADTSLQEGDHRKARKETAKTRDDARQDQERKVIALDFDTDDEDAPITSATRKKARGRDTAAANRSASTESPSTRTISSTPAPVGAVGYWNDGAQCQDEQTEDGWDCNVCTFRNAKSLNALDLACAVCTHRRCP